MYYFLQLNQCDLFFVNLFSCIFLILILFLGSVITVWFLFLTYICDFNFISRFSNYNLIFFFCFCLCVLILCFMHATLCYIFLSPCTLLKGNKSQSWGITRAGNGVKSRTKLERLAGCQATTLPPSTAWTSSRGTMDRFPEMPRSIFSAVESMAASLLGKVKVAQVKGQSRYDLRGVSTTTELVMTLMER